MKERRDWRMLKITYKAPHQTHAWPAYLPLKVKSSERLLRSSAATQLQVPFESGTFQATASQLVNKLPADIRNFKDFNEFFTAVQRTFNVQCQN
jgi:hypothetical protein